LANNLHISYDLINPGQSYDRLIEKIKELGSWAKVGYSFWYVRSSYTSAEARDFLLPYLDKNDKIYVVDATNGAAAWQNISAEVSDFVREKWHKN
jgi:hypothetical protein